MAQLGTPQAYAATYCKVDFQQQLDSYQNISIIGQLLAQVQSDAAQTARRGSTLARILAAASGPPHGGLRVACGLSEPSELAAMTRPAMIITSHQYPFDLGYLAVENVLSQDPSPARCPGWFLGCRFALALGWCGSCGD